jgi:hypothetical protein
MNQKANIETVLRAIAMENNRKFSPPQRDKYVVLCIGHDDREHPSMSVDRRRGIVHCFGPCRRPDDGRSAAGILFAPLLLGVAQTRRESIRWLLTRGLIPEVQDAPTINQPPAPPPQIWPTEPSRLLPEARALRKAVLTDMALQFGKETLQKVRACLHEHNSLHLRGREGERILAFYAALLEANKQTNDPNTAHALAHRLHPSLLRHRFDPTCSCND